MRSARIAGWAAGVLCAVSAVLASACDPCAGVSACREPLRLAVEGRVVDAIDGHAISGAAVTVVRPGTPATPADSVTVTTDETGTWQAAISAPSAEVILVDIVIAARGNPAYRVKGIRVVPTEVHGDGEVLETWVANLYFPSAAELYYRGRPDRPVSFQAVRFDRTGGTQLAGKNLVGESYSSATDAFGHVPLFGQDLIASSEEDVIGDLNVSLPSPFFSAVIRNVHVRPTHLFRPPGDVIRLGVGPNLAYVARLYRRATGAALASVPIEFHRTGGIAVAPTAFTAVSDASGSFTFPLEPLASGTLIGDLTLNPSGPAPTVIRGIPVPTFEADGSRLLAAIGVGPHLPWVGIVHAQAKGIAGVQVIATRVGGIAVDPASITAVSDPNGVFPLFGFAPRDTGNLIVDLSFHPPSPFADFVVRGVVLRAIDVDANAFIVAVWDVDRPNTSASAKRP